MASTLKANILVNTLNMDKDTWRQYRRMGLGGSDIGSICGVNPYSSPLKVYFDKIGEAEDIEENEKMYWGTTLESVVADEFSKRTGKKVKRCNAMLQHPEYPFMLANVDRLIVGENAILECKTASAHMEKEWIESIPDSYMLQIQHYMLVGSFEKAYIAVLIGGNTFVWKEIPRDEELISYIIDIEKDFWNKVVNHIPPAIDASEATTEALKLLYPTARENAPALILENKFDILLRDREDCIKVKKQMEEEINEIENRIKSVLGETETAETNEYVVRWKNCKGKETFDGKLFKKEHPELISKYYKQGNGYRTFSVNKKEMTLIGK